jgi:hypothetical protein
MDRILSALNNLQMEKREFTFYFIMLFFLLASSKLSLAQKNSPVITRPRPFFIIFGNIETAALRKY